MMNNFLENLTWQYTIVFHILNDKYWHVVDHYFRATQKPKDIEDEEDDE